MLRKNISIILSILTLISAIMIAPMTADAKSTEELADTGAAVELAETGWTIPSEKTFVQRLAQLKKKYYPSGYSGAYYEDGHAMAWQCYGFAVQMLHDVFGIKYYADGFVNRADYTLENIYAGDVVRIRGNTHSIFITKVTSKGYYFCDANWDYNNGVRWDAFFTKAEMASTFTYKIHVPGSKLMGTETVVAELYAQTPELLGAQPTGNGIEVTWNVVKDACAYRVYYKEGEDTGWKSAGKTTNTSYVFNTNLVYGKKYTFTVRALDSYGMLISAFNKTGVSCEYRVSPPEMKTIKSTVGNIKVTWAASKGVTLYRLYYKTSATAKWKKLADVSGTSYNFKKGTPYTTYRFTAVCMNSRKQAISGAAAKVLSARFMTADTQLDIPVNITPAATKTLGRIRVSWDAVIGAKRYAVFVSKNGATSGWKKIGTTTKNYFDYNGCKNATKYRFTVRCIDNKGKFLSGFKAGNMLYYFDYPTKLNAVQADDNGKIIVSWAAVKKAPAYAVFYKSDSDPVWKRLNTKAIIGTSTTFTEAEDGETYYFTVRVCDKQMRNLSSYLDAGVSITYLLPVEENAEDATGAPNEDATGAPNEDATGAPNEDATGSPNEDPTGAPNEDPTGAPSEDPTGEPSTNAPISGNDGSG